MTEPLMRITQLASKINSKPLLERDTDELPRNELWKLGKESFHKAAKETIQKVKRGKSEWISEEARG